MPRTHSGGAGFELFPSSHLCFPFNLSSPTNGWSLSWVPSWESSSILMFKFTALLSHPHIHGPGGQSTRLLSLEFSLLPEVKVAALMGPCRRLGTEQAPPWPLDIGVHYHSAGPLEGDLLPSAWPQVVSASFPSWTAPTMVLQPFWYPSVLLTLSSFTRPRPPLEMAAGCCSIGMTYLGMC